MQTEAFKLKDVSFLTIPQWELQTEGLTVGFSTRASGLSSQAYSSLNLGLHVHDDPKTVIKNREILAEKTRFPLNSWVFAEQIHSSHIEKISKYDCGKGMTSYKDGISNCDGVYTSEKGIMLSLCFADCVPLFFVAPKKSMIGLAHAGWKGTVSNIGGKMVEKWMNEEGIQPSEIMAAIGPSIEDCCYIVDDRVISAINQDILKKYPLPYNKISEGQYRLDLKQLNKILLINSGLKEENIFTSQQCTSCEKDLFFSHRRDDGKTGRMLSFIGMK